jgi:hypothetical protein
VKLELVAPIFNSLEVMERWQLFEDCLQTLPMKL